MRAYPLLLGLLLTAPLPAPAADLAKIERTIAKEPQYQGKPQYCLLVIGPEAKFRVWLVLDGAVLYVDRDGSGDLTAPDNRVTPIHNRDGVLVFRPGIIGSANDQAKYTLRVSGHHGAFEMSLRVDNRDNLLAGFDGPGKLAFADRPAAAPIVHFLGPLTLLRFEPQPGCASPHLQPLPLVRGKSNHLAFSVGHARPGQRRLRQVSGRAVGIRRGSLGRWPNHHRRSRARRLKLLPLGSGLRVGPS